MPRYFFHIRNGQGFVEDEEGRELDDADRALAIAIDSVRSLLSEEVRAGQLDLRGRIEVNDAEGRMVLAVPFSEALDIRIGSIPPDKHAPADAPTAPDEQAMPPLT